MTRSLRLLAAASAAALLLSACGGGGGGPATPAPDASDLAGVWAGAWEGRDPSLGAVGGTWVAEFAQSGSTLTGTGALLGDVDCIDGTAAGGLDANGQLAGTLDRSPCQMNQWRLTTLDRAAYVGSGTWTQTGSNASGSLVGRRIAVPGGPRVVSLHPPAARPGAIVTLAGQSLGAPGGPPLAFANTGQPQLLASSGTRWVARVPAGAATGWLTLNASNGSAIAPVMFRAEAASPAPIVGWRMVFNGTPRALAYSRDGRKVFVAQATASGGAISVVQTAKRLAIVEPMTAGAVTALATSPDGRLLFASVAGVGVQWLDSALATPLATVAVPVTDAAVENPGGLATSPDGALIAVSEGRTGGRITLLRSGDRGVVWQAASALDEAPLGVAFAPAGDQLYVASAATGRAGALRRFDVASGAEGTPIAVGQQPVSVAITPDGGTAFVAQRADHRVARIDLATGVLTVQAGVALSPTGLAVSSDGTRVFATSRTSDGVTLLDTASGSAVAGSPLAIGGLSGAIAMDPQGLSAMVALPDTRSIAEIGGALTLTVVLSGDGRGSVQSSPAGIQCGTACIARFPAGSTVNLTASADTGSRFAGWSGNGCGGGPFLPVTLSADTLCTAIFSATSAPPAAPNGGPCFIATAAYGSPMASEVQLLRDFRDRRLMPSSIGRSFVALYYRVSPPIADAIRDRPLARATVRALLWPMVTTLREPSVGLAAVALLSLGGLIGLRRRAG